MGSRQKNLVYKDKEKDCKGCLYFLDDFKSPTGKKEYYCAYIHDFLKTRYSKCKNYKFVY